MLLSVPMIIAGAIIMWWHGAAKTPESDAEPMQGNHAVTEFFARCNPNSRS